MIEVEAHMRYFDWDSSMPSHVINFEESLDCFLRNEQRGTTLRKFVCDCIALHLNIASNWNLEKVFINGEACTVLMGAAWNTLYASKRGKA